MTSTLWNPCLVLLHYVSNDVLVCTLSINKKKQQPKNLCQTYDKSAYNMCLIYNLGSYLSHLLLAILKLVIDIYSSAKEKITMIPKGDNISMTNFNMFPPFLVSSFSY